MLRCAQETLRRDRGPRHAFEDGRHIDLDPRRPRVVAGVGIKPDRRRGVLSRRCRRCDGRRRSIERRQTPQDFGRPWRRFVGLFCRRWRRLGLRSQRRLLTNRPRAARRGRSWGNRDQRQGAVEVVESQDRPVGCRRGPGAGCRSWSGRFRGARRERRARCQHDAGQLHAGPRLPFHGRPSPSMPPHRGAKSPRKYALRRVRVKNTGSGRKSIAIAESVHRLRNSYNRATRRQTAFFEAACPRRASAASIRAR